MAENVKRKKKKRAVLIVLMALVLAVLAVVCVYETELNKLDSNDGVDNSFYDSQFKNKKVMVIVPHEDDDLLISGQVLPPMYKNGADVRVVFATNGDKRVSAYTRQSEACNALEKLGIPREKVIFLGYPDGTQLYVGKKAFSFSSGWDHTYAGKGFKDYHFDRFGTHAKYTAENMVDDIESVVLEYRPDYILAIDFDTHTDHRGVSISFEKAMERILKKESGYTPKVLKCFGYSLAWKSKPDFYALNIKSTVMQDREKNNDPSYETDVPQYRWNNRIRLPIDKKSLSHSILRCSEYKALSEHLSQYAYCYSERIINGDSVYWNRRTDSLTYNADISVSSGDASLLNDFRLIGVGNRTAGLHVKLENCVSRFDKNDAQKTVTVKFDSPKTVSCVSLYDNFGLNSNILGGVITFSDGSKVEVPALNADGSETRVVFEPKHNITSFTFKVTEYEGVAGLDEIEAFENADYDMDFSLIKLKNADTDDYIYNYLITPDEKSLNLGVYLSDPNAGYTIKIIEGDSVKLEGNTLVFDDDFEKCTVRAELNGDPSTYDQITVKRLSERELKSYESFEKVNKTVFKIDTLRLKTKNLFVNGYVYEELNDFVKSLEKKAGIEISE
ncbi:MAG: PIG-L family deacetylase [Acutalibacteraceae bacterium]|jgi:LmbE family N-acetylglucosaminyl deacetylase|nr:PIG-L family deacetylase [Acutalibacteraceae bacterium]